MEASSSYTPNNKRIAKNTAFLYFRMLCVMGVSLFTSRIILNALGFSDYGLYNVIGGLVTMFSFLNGALAGASSRFITYEMGTGNFEKLNKTFNATLMVHIALALIVVVLAETIGLWFLYYKMTIPVGQMNTAFWVYQISIFSCVFAITQVPYNACIIAHENMKIYGYVGVIEALLKLAIAYAIVYIPKGKLLSYAILLCGLQVGIMVYYRFYCLRYKETKIQLNVDKAICVDIFKFSGSDLIGNISVLAQGQGLNLLLNVFFGPTVNAARAISYQVQGAVTQFTNNFFTAVRPQIIKSYAASKLKEMMDLVYYSSWFSYYLMLAICLPIIYEADTILHIWLDAVPDYTNSFLRLVLVLCLIQTLKTPRTTVFHATGHILRPNVIVGLILCMAFPLAYVFLKCGFSPNSVFWAAITTMIVSEFFSIIILKRYVDFSITDYLLQIHGRCAIVTLLCVICITPLYLYMSHTIWRFVLVTICSVASVVIFSYIFGINSKLRNLVVKFVVNKVRKAKSENI